MAQLWQMRSVRLVGLAAGGSLLTLALSSCTVFPVTVNSVTGTYVPDPPVGGIPAEQVDFTVHGSPTADLVCLIEVFNDSGQMVGSTVSTTGEPSGSSSQDISEAVPITGDNFNGTSSNAVIRCEQK